VGGAEAAAWSLGGLRSAFGFVPQDSFLFSASIKENIAFGAPEADDETLLAAATAAALIRDLELFPQGWDTLVGERGLSLSGGQKQRVAIARALAIDPEILVLDDALSAVDAETEESILSSILERRRGKTTLMVSHRIAALRRMDSVIVLEGGAIIQAGTHAELMKEESGFYAQIAGLQAIDEGGAA
jgi:ATP-binding cassette subfamily B protein